MRSGEILFNSSSSFVTSVAVVSALPLGDMPEIAFAGRSNVGKSSLLNALLGRKDLVKASKTPGRTQLLNFFNLGDVLHLVDMPGYGYAKAPKDVVTKWERLGRSYLRGRKNLRLLCLLVDARRGFMKSDRDFCRQLDKSAVAYLLVLTKCDKLSEGAVKSLQAKLTVSLGDFSAAYPHIFMTSVVSGLGLAEVRSHIASVIEFSREGDLGDE